MKTKRENVTKGLCFWIWIFVFISSAVNESSQNSSSEDKMTPLSEICTDIRMYCRILEIFFKPLANMKEMESEVRNLTSALNHLASKIPDSEKNPDNQTHPRQQMHQRLNDSLVSVYQQMDQLNHQRTLADVILANLKQYWEDLGRQLASDANLTSQRTSEAELKNRFREVTKSFEKFKTEKLEIETKWETLKERVEKLKDKSRMAGNCHNDLDSHLNTLRDSVLNLRRSTGETNTLLEASESCDSLGIVKTNAVLP